MEKKEIQRKVEQHEFDIKDLEKKSELETKYLRKKELEAITNSDDFWNDIEKTKEVIQELKNINSIIDKFEIINNKMILVNEMMTLDLTEKDLIDLETELCDIETHIGKLIIDTLLNGEYDTHNAFIEIHSGAGGTESNDWANMLLRMYTRFFDKKGYTYEIMSEQKGEEVGIKGVTVLVKGYFPYGYLKGETGVHRLVRISPFDSNSRRHTSFASVLVTPEISKNFEVDIKESDLKIDVYHASGAGGQSVNTTDSAVRITHIPSGIVVSCQVERSQLKNKDRALSMLKQKLYMLSLKEFGDKIKALKGDTMDVNFGSAVRSYVMCPYTLVKDSRSSYETSNVDKVLDGEIEELLESYLKV